MATLDYTYLALLYGYTSSSACTCRAIQWYRHYIRSLLTETRTPAEFVAPYLLVDGRANGEEKTD